LPKLPVVSGAEAIRKFEHLGWTSERTRGSHVIMSKPGSIVTLTIPLHKELGPGLLRTQLRKAGVSVEDFIAAG
jgi:predicted RNA binding protein YcfA (HicA-like mRNA interferase family)